MNVFECGVRIQLIDRVSGGMGQIARSLTRSQAAADALNARLRSISGTFKSGLVMAAGGAALAAPLIAATKSAMDLQSALGRVQVATGASNAEMSQLNRTLTDTANVTGIFSKVNLASFAGDMYASGIRNMAQINQLLPLFAKSADLMKIMSNGRIGPTETAHTLSALAHQFGRYTPKDMTPIAQAAIAIAPSLPGGLATLRNMGAYVNVLGNRVLGVDPVRLMELEAAIAQTSGGRGSGRGGLSGAQVMNALRRSMPGVFGAGLLTGKSAFSAEVMGLAHGGVSTVFKDGRMDLNKLIDVISRFEAMPAADIARRMQKYSYMLGKKQPEEDAFLRNFLKTPGAPKSQLVMTMLTNQAGTASGVMQLLGDPKFKSVLAQIDEKVKHQKSIEEMQKQVMTMLQPQLARLQTNFETLRATIGTQLIPVLTPLVKNMGDLLYRVNAIVEMHPRIVQAVAGLTAAMSAALLFGGAIKIVTAGFRGLRLVLGVFNSAGIIARTAGWLAGLIPNIVRLGAVVLAAFGWEAIVPIVAAVTAVVVICAKWKDIMRAIHSHSALVVHILAQVVRAFHSVGDLAKQAATAVQGLGKKFMDLMKWLGDVAKKIVDITGMTAVSKSLASLIQPLRIALSKAAKPVADSVANGWKNLTTVDQITQKRDEKYLNQQGFSDVVKYIKGTNPPRQNVTVNSVVNIHAAKGVDTEKLGKEVSQHVRKELKKAVGDILHVSNASSGNAVGRSINANGNYRP